jgi:hypothetical protein
MTFDVLRWPVRQDARLKAGATQPRIESSHRLFSPRSFSGYKSHIPIFIVRAEALTSECADLQSCFEIRTVWNRGSARPS